MIAVHNLSLYLLTIYLAIWCILLGSLYNRWLYCSKGSKVLLVYWWTDKEYFWTTNKITSITILLYNISTIDQISFYHKGSGIAPKVEILLRHKLSPHFVEITTHQNLMLYSSFLWCGEAPTWAIVRVYVVYVCCVVSITLYFYDIARLWQNSSLFFGVAASFKTKIGNFKRWPKNKDEPTAAASTHSAPHAALRHFILETCLAM